MSVDPEKFIPTEFTEDQSQVSEVDSFEAEILARIKADYERAKTYRQQTQLLVLEHEQQYNNSARLEELKVTSAFPLPIAQQLCDQLRSYMLDKLYFAERPCRIVGTEDQDKQDAEAKQAMSDWQDYRDDIKQKIGRAIIDCAVRKVAVAQVDYSDTTRAIWQVIDKDKQGNPIEPTFIKVRVPDYIGAIVKMVDPQELYFGPDKRQMNDSFPIMIRSDQPRGYFFTQDYFFNQERIEDKGGNSSAAPSDSFRSRYLDNPTTRTSSECPHEYVEWHGIVNKQRVLQYMESKGRDVSEPWEAVKPGEKCWAIAGMVNQDVIVRLEEQAHGISGPNIVIGCIEHKGSPFDAMSIMDKIHAICVAADNAAGMLITNIEQNIDAGWIINKSKLVNKGPITINSRKFLLETNADVREVAMRICRWQKTPRACSPCLSGRVTRTLRRWARLGWLNPTPGWDWVPTCRRLRIRLSGLCTRCGMSSTAS
jgi:hypothetical protein